MDGHFDIYLNHLSPLQGYFLRRGGTSLGFDVNLPGEAIKLLGDWASDCYRRYIDVTLEARLKAMTVFTQNM